MRKSDLIRRATPEEATELREREREHMTQYAMNMYLLQSEAGLSFKEARAVMIPYHETNDMMAIDLGTDVRAVYNLQRRAKKKIEKTGMSFEDIVGAYLMEKAYIISCQYG
jgi:hypothetical protein